MTQGEAIMSARAAKRWRLRLLLLAAGVGTAASLAVVVGFIVIATAPRPRGDCRLQLVRTLDAIREQVRDGRPLEEGVRDVEASGFSLECAGKPIRFNPDPYLWTEDGAERQEILLIATAVFEGKESIIDVEGEPFCYGIDALWTVHGIPVRNLPEWAK